MFTLVRSSVHYANIVGIGRHRMLSMGVVIPLFYKSIPFMGVGSILKVDRDLW